MKRCLLFAVLCLFLSSWGQSVYAQKKSVILKYTGFTVQYNPNNRQPDWADYTLTAVVCLPSSMRQHVEMSNNTPNESKASVNLSIRYFMPDPKLSLPQATPADYSKSGWVRGHMARRQDMKWSEQAIKESDYFTNICPQNDVMWYACRA